PPLPLPTARRRPTEPREAVGRGPWAEDRRRRRGAPRVRWRGGQRTRRSRPCSPAPARRRLGLPPALVALSACRLPPVACRLSPAVRRLPTRRPPPAADRRPRPLG